MKKQEKTYFFKLPLAAVQICAHMFDAVAVGYLAAFEKPAATPCFTATNTALRSGNTFGCHLYSTLLLLLFCDPLEFITLFVSFVQSQKYVFFVISEHICKGVHIY